MKYFIWLCLYCTYFFSFSQQVQWASRVLEFSSQKGKDAFSTKQLLGEPNVLPAHGYQATSWSPSQANNSMQFVKVGFEEPMQIRQVIIAENNHPGAISKVFLYDENGKEHLIGEFHPKAISRASRMFTLFFNLTDYKVSAVKIVLNGKAVKGYNCIDAIGISSISYPIEFFPKVAKEINPKLKVQTLGDNVNSEYEEHKPIISPNGKVIYFSRVYHPENTGGVKDPEDIWFSTYNDSLETWNKSENLGAPLNTKQANYISSLTPDGKDMIVMLGGDYEKNKDGVSISHKTQEGWGTPKKLLFEKHTNLKSSNYFFLANNHKVLLLTMKNEKHYDMYVSFLKEDSVWSKPTNLGITINTVEDEYSPFLAADNRTLYFSSNGYSSFGGTDIFVSRRIGDGWTEWTQPENLGNSINTPHDDEFFTMPLTGDFAYYSRGISKNNQDIYQLSIPDFFKPEPIVIIKGKVLDKENETPIKNVQILYERLDDGIVLGTSETDEEGNYEIVLPYGENYGFLAEATGYLALSKHIDLSEENEHKEIEKNLYLVQIHKGSKVSFNNIFFDVDKYHLKKESFPELNRVVKFLENNPTAKIEIIGHTDMQGSTDYNIKLANKRAQEVSSYFEKQGISDERLQIKAIKNSQKEENIRKVEFKIIHE